MRTRLDVIEEAAVREDGPGSDLGDLVVAVRAAKDVAELWPGSIAATIALERLRAALAPLLAEVPE